MWLKTANFFQSQLGFPFYSTHFNVDHFELKNFTKIGIIFPDKLNNAVVKRQAEYLAGRVCAKNVLSTIGIKNFQVISGEDRAPIWPAKVCGSITHTQSIAAAIVSSNPDIVGLGIDIECSMKENQEKCLQSHILAHDEKNSFSKLSKLYSNPLTIIFSAKESIYKALYPTVRKFFDFNAVTLIELDDKKLIFIINKPLAVKIPQGTLITVYYQRCNNFVFTECFFT